MIYFSPLQGLTTNIFRNAIFQVGGGIDKYFAPYVSLVQKNYIQTKQLKDISPALQTQGIPLIPQIMGKDADDIKRLCLTYIENGYSEINWNLGCPYPMVTNRGCGAGAIADTDNIKKVLDTILAIDGIRFSIKMRTGFESCTDFEHIAPTIKEYPLHELIVHPRTAKQLYKGEADREFLAKYINVFPFPLIYNGDITNTEDGKTMLASFQNIAIGRGIVSNPLLACMIKDEKPVSGETYEQAFWKIHDLVVEGYSQRLDGGDAQLTRKMYEYWQFWGKLFPENQKDMKKIKKCSRMDKYTEIIHHLQRDSKISIETQLPIPKDASNEKGRDN